MIGPLFPRTGHGLNWQYFLLSRQAKIIVKPYPSESDERELYLITAVDSISQTLTFSNTTVEELDDAGGIVRRRAFEMNDLLEKHPSIPGMYRVFGRADDQLVFTTGFKVCNLHSFLMCLDSTKRVCPCR